MILAILGLVAVAEAHQADSFGRQMYAEDGVLVKWHSASRFARVVVK
ncbi:hypothetical protein [Streptomyces silvisoli]|uniref:Uncharacterized protein n=1 Tax=Streptomyces silvisoli TaxID=3034235 RepID=A0ABT5ZJY1_9ACTN|nr:hypothetical protein [Streptomyces silvisoli]MDF3290134.1 hypothetical protein [Streptomyces silvisoli]